MPAGVRGVWARLAPGGVWARPVALAAFLGGRRVVRVFEPGDRCASRVAVCGV